MILRYINEHFCSIPIDHRIGLLKYDQFLVILKNKYLNAPNEDIILDAIESWIEGNKLIMINTLQYDRDGVSEDNGNSLRQILELFNNVNWPLVSLN